MINKCPKCKSEIRADEQVNWKCASCKRSFKISFSRLDSVLSRKQSGDTIFQLKCPSCGKNLDSGREEISWSCFECGNKVSGNLMGFKEQMSGSVRNGNQNKGTVQQNTNINRNIRKRRWTGSVLMIIGALAISIGVLGLLEGILYGSTGFNISIFLVSIISGVSFCGFAEIIQLLEDINWKLDKKDE